MNMSKFISPPHFPGAILGSQVFALHTLSPDPLLELSKGPSTRSRAWSWFSMCNLGTVGWHSTSNQGSDVLKQVLCFALGSVCRHLAFWQSSWRDMNVVVTSVARDRRSHTHSDFCNHFIWLLKPGQTAHSNGAHSIHLHEILGPC